LRHYLCTTALHLHLRRPIKPLDSVNTFAATAMNDTRRRMNVPLLPGMRMQDPRTFAKPRTQTLAVKNGVHGVYKLVSAHPPAALPMIRRGIRRVRTRCGTPSTRV
jgi:hypothetical protein